jgi:DNA polymerase III delta prime subunit
MAQEQSQSELRRITAKMSLLDQFYDAEGDARRAIETLESIASTLRGYMREEDDVMVEMADEIDDLISDTLQQFVDCEFDPSEMEEAVRKYFD